MLNKFSSTIIYVKVALISLSLIPLGNVLLRELQIDAQNSNFEQFESDLYMKSQSMPLRIQPLITANNIH